MSDDAALASLAEAPALRALESHVPPLSLARAFGIAHDEVKHSRLLGHLFDSSKNEQAMRIVRELLGALLEDVRAAKSELALRVEQVLAEPWARVATRLELFRVDVVIDIASPSGGLVVGIENKINAGEQTDQLARYQASLATGFAGRPVLLVFLTPTGRRPQTVNIDANVPTVDLGYARLNAVLEASLKEVPSGSRVQRVLSEIIDHVREDILGQDDQSVQAKVRELWREHPKALSLATRNRPRLAGIEGAFRQHIVPKLGADATFLTYPGRGDLREIKLSLRGWHERGLPFTFMLYAQDFGPPAVRVLVGDSEFQRDQEKLKAWAKRAEAQGLPVDATFPTLKDWGHWHRVLSEADYPPDSFLESWAFDAAVAREAADRVLDLVERLRPTVEG